jgi:hypothetical protein
VSVTTENFEVCALALMPEADGATIQKTLLETGFDFQEVSI